MTPEEAERFYEEDEDPRKVFTAYDAGPWGITAAPAAVGVAAQVRWCRAYIREHYGPA